MSAELLIKDLKVTVEGKEILKGLNLEIKQGEVVAVMGPNGSGKSTLAYILMGHPKYKIETGQIIFNGEDITRWPTDKRAKAGLFLSFQYPQEVSGVTLASFLRAALNSARPEDKKISVLDFHKLMKEKMQFLKIDDSFSRRYLNEGFSGGEKKRAEILQLCLLQPKIAILDEPDSGTDVDALRIIADGINALKKSTNMGILLITHYNRILEYIRPDKIVVLVDGVIVKIGGPELATQIEQEGFTGIKA